MSGNQNVAVKPLVKHILSKELQQYFERVCNAFLDESSEEYRISAFSSLREDPGLHQLVPYFVQFIAEKVTHSLKDIFVLTQVMHMAEALIQNKSLYVDPYVGGRSVFCTMGHGAETISRLHLWCRLSLHASSVDS
jgi:transcription initiation factor TFIID subunit 6